MGLDWIARPRMDGMLEINPLETLGFKRLNRDQPETITTYRAIWQSHFDTAERGDTNPEHKKFWLRPFEEVLEEQLAIPEPMFLEGTGEKVPDFITGGSFAINPNISWRGKRIRYCGLPDAVVERSYGDDKEEHEFTIDGAKAFATELEEYADAPDRIEVSPGNTLEQIVETLREGAAFLRFWAEKGHPVWCWW